MKFTEFYKEYLDGVEEFESDEVHCCEDDAMSRLSDQELIDALVAGTAGPGDAGEELARRGKLHTVPGDNWGWA